VLPASPLPSVADSLILARKSVGLPAVTVKPVPPRRRWAAAVALALLVAAALCAIALVGTWRGRDAEKLSRLAQERRSAESQGVALKHAREHLAVGNFRQALASLQNLQVVQPGKRWEPLLAQASLLADLCSESLDEILAHAAGAQPAEWELEFPARYRGKAFVFDVVMSGPAGEPYHHTWPVRPDVHMDFAEVQLLQRLPLTEPTRVLFGVRLAEVRRDTPASWEVRFDPAGGVLLTEPEAVSACCPYLDEAELNDLVRRQSGWLP
jgi:hypothetical protein